jgi:SAM-dependent methyltransferase
MPLHEATKGFDTAAEEYERGRPDYPPDAVAALVSALRLTSTSRVLELGAGTGKLTHLLAGKAAAIVALEPVAGMRRKLAAVEGARILGGTAEALPLRADAFDAAVAASAFHWFDGARALVEIHRVLRPGARLALLWNRRDDSVDWVARMSEIVNRHEGNAPRYRKGEWRHAFDVAPGLFGPLAERHFPHVHALAPDGVLARVASISFVAAMPQDRREGVLAEVRALLATHPDTRGREEVPLAYVADLHWCMRA